MIIILHNLSTFIIYKTNLSIINTVIINIFHIFVKSFFRIIIHGTFKDFNNRKTTHLNFELDTYDLSNYLLNNLQ